MHSGNKWVGYDTPDAVGRKINYVKTKGFGGGMIWAIDLDDFNGLCGDGGTWGGTEAWGRWRCVDIDTGGGLCTLRGRIDDTGRNDMRSIQGQDDFSEGLPGIVDRSRGHKPFG